MPESPNNEEKNAGERAGQIEKLLGSEIETILQTGNILNWGNKGLVYKFETGNINRDVFEYLKTKNVPVDIESIIKVIKIYKPGEGKKEFEMLKKAHEIIKNIPPEEKNNFALVPQPMLFRDITISETTKEILNKQGASIFDRAEILLMVYIPGKDLATVLYDYALERLGYGDEFIKNAPLSEKNGCIITSLEYEKPSGKAVSEGEKEFERIMVYKENESKLYAFLQKNGFKLSAAIPQKIESAVNLFHKNNLFHNDLHERNIIIKDGEVFIIDFGSATETPVEFLNNQKVLNDFSLPQRLKNLTSTPEEKEQKEIDRIIEDIETGGKRLKATKWWQKKYEEMTALFKKNPANFLEYKLNNANIIERERIELLTALEGWLGDENVTAGEKKDIKKFIAQIPIKNSLTPNFQNQLILFLKNKGWLN